MHSAAATSSSYTLEFLLHHERANRLIQQKTIQPSNLGFDEVLEALISHIFEGITLLMRMKRITSNSAVPNPSRVV